jgi:hypothetical protein
MCPIAYGAIINSKAKKILKQLLFYELLFHSLTIKLLILVNRHFHCLCEKRKCSTGRVEKGNILTSQTGRNTKFFFKNYIYRSDHKIDNRFRSVIDTPFFAGARIILFKEGFVEVNDWITPLPRFKVLFEDQFYISAARTPAISSIIVSICLGRAPMETKPKISLKIPMVFGIWLYAVILLKSSPALNLAANRP